MDYEVIIVGGGPAGSTAAATLAQHNKNVLVLDKHSFPREKPCGGGLSSRVWKDFPYVTSFIESYSNGAITHSSSFDYTFSVNRKQPMLGMIQRETFDQHLLQYAKQQGANILLNSEVINISKTSNGFTIQLQDATQLTTNLLIGCDGIRSIVAKQTGLNDKHHDLGICIYKEQSIPQTLIDSFYSNDRLSHIFIKTQDIPGYGWVFPKNNCINVGMGQFFPTANLDKPNNNLHQQFCNYIELLQKKQLLPLEVTCKDAKGALLPLHPVSQTYDDGVMLCGDAAGFINPISGEGIYYAMMSGKLAAITASEAIQQHSYSRRFLSGYHRRCMNSFQKDILMLQRYKAAWNAPNERIMNYMSKDPVFAKMILGVVGGQLSFSKYKLLLGIRYGYLRCKDVVSRSSSKKPVKQ